MLPRCFVLLLLAACASPAAVREGKVRQRYRQEAGYPAQGLPESTRDALEERGWGALPPDEAAALMEAAAQSDRALRLELAELHFLGGDAFGALHAARNAWQWMAQAGTRQGPDRERARRLYNAAVTAYVLGGAPVPEEYAGVLAAWEVPAGAFRERVTRAGLGAPLVAVREHTDERDAEQPYWPPVDVGVALTAVLRFDGPRPSLQLHDPLVEETVRAFGEPVPLAADFTAPLAYLYAQVDADARRRRAGRVPALDHAGFVLLEPPRRDKTPVVFLHGLDANPGDFRWMVNELRADPEVRRRYQFVAYRYAATLPLPLLALDLRDRMAAFFQWFDERAPGAREHGYVAAGHGLGGLLAKTLAVRSREGIHEAVFRVPRAEVDFSGALGERLRRALFLEPDPKLARVVFLAVPHHGSAWAEGSQAEFVRASIRPPPRVVELRDAVRARWGPQLRPEIRARLYDKVSVVDNLRTDDPYRNALAGLRIEVPCDSVIGNLSGATVKPTTDGVVRYESAHLEGADSETVVRSGHDVHRTKLGIAAVRDILKRHGR